MNINEIKNGNSITLKIDGTIDTNTAPILNDYLLSLDYENLDLTFDFENLDYITSAGLRALLVARKKLANDKMRVINANETIVDIFKMTGFNSFISIENSADISEQYRLSFSALLNKRVATDCNRIAYIYKDKEYTWLDIEKTSKIIADDLAKLGVKKGSHVGLCSVNNVHWVCAFYAIQKLGGISVFISPALRPNEVVSLCQIGDVEYLCYGETIGITTFAEYKDACLNRGKIAHMYDISDHVDFESRYSEYDGLKDKYNDIYPADDASVIIFSSGSTGLPKAILSSSYSIMVSIEPLIKKAMLNREDKNLAFLPFFHIFGFASSVGVPLLVGMISIIPEKKSPNVIINLINKYKCTMFNTVPTMYLSIVQSDKFNPELLSSLRISILGGAITTQSQMEMLNRLLPNIHFGNIYGMSENAAVSLTEYNDSIEHITQTVGRPVQGLELIIRDLETNEVLGVGQEGEICIKSNAMVICYYNLPIEKQPIDDEGFLSTGDIGVLDADGYLRIVGRKKDLIISGGENISPGEIAEAISKLDYIKDVKVVGIPDEIMGEVVAAAIIVKDASLWNEESARQELSKYLAKYKIPKYFVLFDRFPLLGSGKVEAKKIKEDIIYRLDN